jgi:hypothetical protein
MTQPKPKVGDIWKSTSPFCHCLVVEKYLDKEKNTHMLTMHNIELGHLFSIPAVSIRQEWEFMG